MTLLYFIKYADGVKLPMVYFRLPITWATGALYLVEGKLCALLHYGQTRIVRQSRFHIRLYVKYILYG